MFIVPSSFYKYSPMLIALINSTILLGAIAVMFSFLGFMDPRALCVRLHIATQSRNQVISVTSSQNETDGKVEWRKISEATNSMYNSTVMWSLVGRETNNSTLTTVTFCESTEQILQLSAILFHTSLCS